MQQPSHHTSPDGAASLLVAALEHAWQTIRIRHPEVPEAVLVVASGSEGKRLNLGHFAPHRWQVNGADRHEVLVGGEGLQRGPLEVLGTLLHEAAHGLAQARGVQDTSRQGRYHNRRYATLAHELGLGWPVSSRSAGPPPPCLSQLLTPTPASSRTSPPRWCCGAARSTASAPAPAPATCSPPPVIAAAASASPEQPWPRRPSSAPPASNPSSPPTPTTTAIDT
jgi:hypothetical protein